jgi:hypothetical protein
LARSHPISNVIATSHHLLHTRKIVDALLCRLKSSEKEDVTTPKEERKHAQAIGTVAHITRAVPAVKDLENTDPSTKTRCHNCSGQLDQQNGLCREHRPESGGKP